METLTVIFHSLSLQSCSDQLSLRIQVSTGELVGVFYESFLLHVHQDPLTAHGADVVGQAPAGHASLVVVLETHTDGQQGVDLTQRGIENVSVNLL